MIGRLIWNQDRPDIVFDTGTLYGGLHCGDCFACWLDGRWLDVRLEYMNDWVLITTVFLFQFAMAFLCEFNQPTTNLFVFFKNFAGIGRSSCQVIFIGLLPSCFT